MKARAGMIQYSFSQEVKRARKLGYCEPIKILASTAEPCIFVSFTSRSKQLRSYPKTKG